MPEIVSLQIFDYKTGVQIGTYESITEASRALMGDKDSNVIFCNITGKSKSFRDKDDRWLVAFKNPCTHAEALQRIAARKSGAKNLRSFSKRKPLSLDWGVSR